MSRKKETSEKRIAKLRQEPAFRDLLEILKRQTEEQQDRFDEWCEDAEGKEHAMKRPRALKPENVRAYSRALEIQAEGKGWPEIARVLESEGHLTEKGKPFSPDSLRMACTRHREKLLTLAKPDEDAEHAEPSAPQELPSDHAEGYEPPEVPEEAPLPSLHADHYEFPPGMETAVRRIAKEVSEEIVHTMLTVHTTPMDAGELPPEPTTTGKAQNRKYERITLTTDKNLWTAFEQERKRLKVSSRGRMADILLWRVLGKPRLSFEEPEE